MEWGHIVLESNLSSDQTRLLTPKSSENGPIADRRTGSEANVVASFTKPNELFSTPNNDDDDRDDYGFGGLQDPRRVSGSTLLCCQCRRRRPPPPEKIRCFGG